MIILLSEQDQPVTVRPGPDGVVILFSGEKPSLALPKPATYQNGVRANAKGTVARSYVRRIMPVVILGFFAFWGGRYFFPAQKTPTSPPSTLMQAGVLTRSFKTPPPAPPELPHTQSGPPIQQENPNSAFGLN